MHRELAPPGARLEEREGGLPKGEGGRDAPRQHGRPQGHGAPHDGLEIISPQAMHTHTARRAKSEAAREADFDEHRWDVRAFGCAGHDGRTR